ncbi:hypothetical protein L0657_12085 [Dyadobacter sp. CY345]|uniref:hypothetical protein n=1 Tax=Dyadobacter sp. CY345 TaxID=2909335 RepID=UPI001F3E8B47|nr:hypothetical protein [Dyadobacter sp. CY345]MCF2444699.1 hypothetical protein [Dyadobacter sp. CY345]
MKDSVQNSSVDNAILEMDLSELLLIEGGTFGYDVGMLFRFAHLVVTQGAQSALSDYAMAKAKCGC